MPVKIILMLLFSCQIAHAYTSGNTIIIKQDRPRKPSLLDRKFVFLENKTQANNPSLANSSELGNFAKAPSQVPSKPLRAGKNENKTKPSDNWDDFATVPATDSYEESLGVSAKLRLQ